MSGSNYRKTVGNVYGVLLKMGWMGRVVYDLARN